MSFALITKRAIWVSSLTSNTVLLFAKELKAILRKLEREFGKKIFSKQKKIRHLVTKKSSELTEELYLNFKTRLKLKLETNQSSSNIVLTNLNNEEILVPRVFLKSSDLDSVKHKLDQLIIIVNISSVNWRNFQNELFHIFKYENKKQQSIFSNNLEKIRFFSSFVNKFPDFHPFHTLLNKNYNYGF